MSFFHLDIDASRLAAMPQSMERFGLVLDRFVRRAAGESARTMKIEAPKALTTLTNSIVIERQGIADYLVRPTTNYAAAVNSGSRPHRAPLLPLMLWLRHTKHVTDEDALRRRARGLQRFIAQNGTRPNPFLQRTAAGSQARAQQLMRQGVAEANREVFST